jgi:hypothetical protein
MYKHLIGLVCVLGGLGRLLKLKDDDGEALSVMN